MSRRIFALFLCGLLLFAGGCWDILLIEDLTLIIAIGFDEDPENPETMLVTMTGPATSEKAKEPMVKISVKANTIEQAHTNVQRQSSDIIVLGQTNALVFSEEIARSGKMIQIMRELSQRRDLNPNAMLAVIKDAPAQNVLQLEPPAETRGAVFLGNFLERNSYIGLTNKVTATGFWSKHYTLGIDPVAPIIEITGPDEKKTGLRIAGLGVFNTAGKMTGTLTDEEISSYHILTGEAGRLRFTSEVEIGHKQRKVSGLIENVKRKIRTEIKNGKPGIDIQLEIFVDGVDIEWDADVLDPKTIEKFCQLLAKDFQGNIQEMLEKTQKWQADCLGLGRQVRVKHPKWFKGKNWAEEYEKCDISVTVKVTVRRIGTLVKPLS